MLPAVKKVKLLEVMDCEDPPCHEQSERRSETSSQGEKENQCNDASSESSCVKYQSQKHGEGNIYECNDCGKSLSTPASLQRHRLIHEEKSYTCDDCGKSFARLDGFKLHSLKHKKNKPYKCDDCGKLFTLLCTLDQHRLNHSGENSKRDDSGESSTQSRFKQRKVNRRDDKPHKCDGCGKLFTLLCTLEQHRPNCCGENSKRDDCGESSIQSRSKQRKVNQCDDKPHKCDGCGKLFTLLCTLEQHRLNCCGENLKRDDCGESSIQSGFKQRKANQCDDKPHKCDDCGKLFTLLCTLEQHRLNCCGENSKRDDCGESSIQSRLKRRKVNQREDKPHKCDKCGNKFSQLKDLEEHKVLHCGNELNKSGGSESESDVTQGFSDSDPEFIPHSKNVMESKPDRDYSHKCSDCGRSFRTEKGLKMHKLLTHFNSLFTCVDCGKMFNTVQHLKTHRRVHLRETPKTSDKRVESFTSAQSLKAYVLVQNGEKPHKCGQCGKFFTSSQSLTSHRCDHVEYKPHNGNKCGKSSTLPHNFETPKLFHSQHKPLICEKCGKSFTLSSQLKYHELLVHKNETKFKCSKCSFVTFSRDSLSVHLKCHSKKTFACDKCDKVYIWKENLNRHRFIHLGQKPHKCDVCGVSFVHLHGLKKHSLVHIPDRPFRCDVCGKSFTYLKSLKRHMIYHRRLKPHICYQCNRSFFDSAKLKQHILTVHRKKFKCCLCDFSTFFQAKLKSHLDGHVLGVTKKNFDEKFNEAADSFQQQRESYGGNNPYKCEQCGQLFTQLEDLKVHRLVLCNGDDVQKTDEVKSEIHDSDSEFPPHSGPEADIDEADYKINYSPVYSPQKIEGDDFAQEKEGLQTTEVSPKVQVSSGIQEAEQNPTSDNTSHYEVPDFDWELLHHPSPTNFPPASTGKVQQLAAALLAMVPCLTVRDQQEAEFVLSMAVNYPVMADRERNVLYQRLNLLYLAAYHGWPHAMATISNSSL